MAQLFDPLPPDVHAALRDSIQRFGVIVPVVKDQDGNVLDGHHRAAIADELGVEYRTIVRAVADQAEADAIAWTLNADRRQLTAEQRRPIVIALREQGHSQRAIAQATGVSEKQVRKDLATADQSAVPERITGLDGKSRPSKPKKPPPDPPTQPSRRKLSLFDPLTLDDRWHLWLNRATALMTDGDRLAEQSDAENVKLDATAALARFVYSHMRERELDGEILRFFEPEQPPPEP